MSQNGNNIEQNTNSNKNAAITRRTKIIFQVKPKNAKKKKNKIILIFRVFYLFGPHIYIYIYKSDFVLLDLKLLKPNKDPAFLTSLKSNTST